MATDLKLLLWLHWKHLRHSIDYWLGVVGYEPWDRTMSNRLYGIYLAIFLSIWLLIMWSLAVYEAMHLGARLSQSQSDQLRSWVHDQFPWIVLAGAVLLAMWALRSSPLILSDEDLTYIAGAPVRRSAIVLVEFVRRCWQVLRIAVPVTTLLAVLLAHRVSRDEIGLNVIPSALVAIPVILLVWGLAWLLGVVRLGRPVLVRLRAIWLAPLVLLAAGFLAPVVFTWPGRVLTQALLGAPAALPALGVAILAAALAIGLVYAGRRASMLVVAIESATAFRIPSLTSIATLASGTHVETPRAPRRQRVIREGRPLVGLPAASGLRMLLIRGSLVALRRPWPLLLALLGSGALAGSGALLIFRGESARVWLVWLTIVIIRPPRGLLGAFGEDQGTPFLRQFLPVDNLALLAADAALPFSLFIAVAAIGWAVIANLYVAPIWTLGLTVVLALLLVLSQAAVLARAATWDPALARLVFVGIGFGCVLLVSQLADPGSAVIAAACVALILAALIKGGRRATAVSTS